MSVFRGQSETFGGAGFATRALPMHHNSAGAVVGQQASRRRKLASRIDDDANRIGTGDATNRQLGIVGQRATNSNYDGIDERAQPMQMGETAGAIDVTRSTGRRGDAAVERLTDLAHDDELIDLAGS